MKHYTYLFIFLCFSLSTKLLGEVQIRERMYIQTDKQNYLAGELLWLKVYMTDQVGKPASISKVGYVELLDESSASVQAKIELINGIGEGWLEIPPTLSTGYYRLTGYTKYMQNEDESVFFNKYIAVINTFRTDETIEILTDAQPETESVEKHVFSPSNLTISTDKQTYPLRSPGEIYLKNIPSNIRSLAISVAGEELISEHTQTTIHSWRNEMALWLQPSFKQNYLPEYEGHIIDGKIVNILSENTSVNENIVPLLAFVGEGVRLFGGQVKNETDVKFYTKHTGGIMELITTTISASQNKYRVDILSPYIQHSPKQLPILKLNPNWKELLTQRSVGLQVLHSYMADSLNHLYASEAYLKFKPDWSYLLDEYTRFTTMEEVVIEFIMGLRFRRIDGKRLLSVLTEERTGFTVGNSLVLLDGIPIIDHEVIFRYDPLLVKQIDIYKGKYVFGGQLFDGIASFSTYNKDYMGLTLDNTNQFFDYEGTQARRHFYAPSYINEENKRNRIPDFRHTLLWKPNLPLNGEKEYKVLFNTSDLPGEYVVSVEGITTDGQVVYAQYIFQVQ